MTWTVRRVKNSKRVGCRFCSWYSPDSRWWWQATRRAARHEKTEHQNRDHS